MLSKLYHDQCLLVSVVHYHFINLKNSEIPIHDFLWMRSNVTVSNVTDFSKYILTPAITTNISAISCFCSSLGFKRRCVVRFRRPVNLHVINVCRSKGPMPCSCTYWKLLVFKSDFVNVTNKIAVVFNAGCCSLCLFSSSTCAGPHLHFVRFRGEKNILQIKLPRCGSSATWCSCTIRGRLPLSGST